MSAAMSTQFDFNREEIDMRIPAFTLSVSVTFALITFDARAQGARNAECFSNCPTRQTTPTRSSTGDVSPSQGTRVPEFRLPDAREFAPTTRSLGSGQRTRAIVRDMNFNDMDAAFERRRPGQQLSNAARGVSPELDKLIGRLEEGQSIAQNVISTLTDPKGALFNEFREIRDSSKELIVSSILSSTIARTFAGEQRGDPLVRRFSDAAADMLITSPRNVLDRIRIAREELRDIVSSKLTELKEMVRLF
jgi:hypothetical protein